MLNVPYQSQVGNNILNDCGEASGVMVGGAFGKNFTISDMQNAMKRYGVTDILSNLRDGLNHFGVPTSVNNFLMLPFLTEAVLKGKPCICLINYGHVPPYAKIDQTYKGGHFVVVIWVDDKVHYHDPLGRSDQTVTHEEWNYCYLNQALVPDESIITEVLDMDAAEYRAVQTHLEYLKVFKFAKGLWLKNDNGTFRQMKADNTISKSYGTPEELKADGWAFGDER